MELPFTESAFLDLNQAWWPLAIGGWLVSLHAAD